MQDVKLKGKEGLGSRDDKSTVFTVEELQDHRATFDNFDEDGGGTIDAEELETLANDLGITMSTELLEKIDQDGDGLLDFGEFLLLMLDVKRRKEEEKRLENERIRELLEEERGGGDGKRGEEEEEKEEEEEVEERPTSKHWSREPALCPFPIFTGSLKKSLKPDQKSEVRRNAHRLPNQDP